MRKRYKRHVIWKVELEEFKNIVKNSKTLTEITKQLNINPNGGNFQTIKKRCNEDNIDYSHIKLGCDSTKGKKSSLNKFNEHIEIFKKGKIQLTSPSKINNVKKYILMEQNNKCSICGMTNEWNNKIITFILDHIDGNSTNDIPSNLRLVCPNCDSQLPTYKSKNKMGKDSTRGNKYNREYYQDIKRKMPGTDEEIALKATAPEKV